MFSRSFFHDYEPESFYPSPVHYAFAGGNPAKRSPFASTFGDINNNRQSAMNRQREAELAQIERQRLAQLERQRRQHQQQQQQQQQHQQRRQQQQTGRRPVVYRPKPFEVTIDVSDFDLDSLQIRLLDGELIIRSPGNVRYGFTVRRVMLEKKVPLPGDIIDDQLHCQVDRYGRLQITAPRRLATRYESDHESEDDNDELNDKLNDELNGDEDKENIPEASSSTPSSSFSPSSSAESNAERLPREEVPREAAAADSNQSSVPIGTKTEQQSGMVTSSTTKLVKKSEFTESDPDVTVEDEYDD